MVKKLTSEEFCSVAHRKAYHAEQEQLALARLIEDQNRRKPARTPLDKPAEGGKIADLAEYLPQKIELKPPLAIPSAPTLELHFQSVTLHPSSNGSLKIPRGGLAAPELNYVALFGTTSVDDALAALSQLQPLTAADLPTLVILAGPSPRPVAWCEPEVEIPLWIEAIEPLTPHFVCTPAPPIPDFALPESRLHPCVHLPVEAMDFTNAAGAQLPFDLALRFRPLALEPRPAASGSAQCFNIFWEIQSDCGLAPNSGLPSCELADESCGEWLASVPEPRIRQVHSLPLTPNPASPALVSVDPQKHFATILSFGCEVEAELEAMPSAASVPELPEIRAWDPLTQTLQAVVMDCAVAANAPDMVSFGGSIPKLFLRPHPSAPRTPELSAFCEIPQATPRALLVAQSRVARLILARTANKCEPFEDQFSHPDSFLKSISGKRDAGESVFAFNDPIPPKARIASVRRSTLSVVAKTCRGSRQTGISVHPDPAIQPPVMREFATPAKLPLFRPSAKLSILPARSSHSAISALNHFSGAGYQISWQAMQNRWREAPNDLRWIALAVPLVIGLIWFAKSPSAQDGAKNRITSIIPNVSGMMNTSFSGESFEGLKLNIQRRAAVELSDDFRQGLGNWSGTGDWSQGWTYDPAGFIRPRSLALYAPSLNLEDYRFEFLGAIERKALSWVYRAADVNNYYAARLEVTRGGPLPTVELVRYAVINGRPGPRRSIPLPMQGRSDTIYRVRVDVRGSDFVTLVQGQVVDVFSDDRLVRGGVGFFSGPGEDARLRWVEVSHQYDMLGRLCAYLVPYNVTNSNVRSAP